MAREGYYTDVQFFSDSEETTRIHWYKVPHDRPCLPVASFVNDFDWVSDLGPRTSQLKGEPPGFQGERWGDRPWDKRKPPDPAERFTGHYCGSPEQWAGNLSIVNHRDHGHYGCCIPVDQFGTVCGCVRLSGTASGGRRDRGSPCGCVSVSGTSIGYGFPSGEVCGCGSLTGVALGGIRVSGSACACSSVSGTSSGYAFPTGTACGCATISGTASLTIVATGTVCGCSGLSGTALGPYNGNVCGCVAVEGTATFDAFPVGKPCGCVSIVGGGGFTPVVTFTCGDLTPLGSTQSGAALVTTDNVFVRNPASSGAGIRLPAGCNRIVVRYEGGGMSLFNFVIYPPSGGSINGNPVDTGVTFSPGLMTYTLFATTDSLNYRSWTSN